MNTPNQNGAAYAAGRRVRPWPSQAGERVDLTKRQLACLRLAADGLRQDDIAAQLHISVRVVRADIGSAIHQMHARNAMHAVGIAYRTGLLAADNQQVALVQEAERMGYRIALVPVEQSTS